LEGNSPGQIEGPRGAKKNHENLIQKLLNMADTLTYFTDIHGRKEKLVRWKRLRNILSFKSIKY
jgi:hypothetical protein